MSFGRHHPIKLYLVLAVTLAAVALFGLLTVDDRLDAQASEEGYRELELTLQPTTAGAIGLDEDHAGVRASPVVEATFDLVGILWGAGDASEAFIRVRQPDGIWSPWAHVGIHPDPEAESAGSDPIWSRASTAFQVAVVGTATDVRAGLVVSSEATGGSTSPSEASPSATPSYVHPRAEWDIGNDCRPEGEPVTYSDVQGIVIHHTVSAASSQSDVPSAIDAICNYHVNGRGWSDIGYNAIVDAWGGVWEGRTGGLEAGISGAHTAGFNTLTQGVAMLGNWEDVPFPAAQESALIDLLDWMTGWYLIDPDENVTLYSRSDGPKYTTGESVTLPSIMGHRDLGVTSCPGDAGYARLPSIRAAIEPIPRFVDTSGGDEMLVYSDFTGRLRFENLHSSGIVDRPVAYGSVSRGWSVVEAADLDGDGSDEILFYNRGTGAYVAHELTSSGTLGALIRVGALGTGWDAMEPVDADGDGFDELYFYRRSTGGFAFYDLRPDASLGSAIRFGTIGKGWSVVEPLDVEGDGDDEILFYRSSTGQASIYNLYTSGVIGTPIRVMSLAANWDTIEPTDLDTANPGDELLFYRQWSGGYAFYGLSAEGALQASIGAGRFPDQWSSISSPELD